MSPRVQICCCLLPLPLLAGVLGLAWTRRAHYGEVIHFPKRPQ